MQPLVKATGTHPAFLKQQTVLRPFLCLPYGVQPEENDLPRFQMKKLIVLWFITQLKNGGHFPF